MKDEYVKIQYNAILQYIHNITYFKLRLSYPFNSTNKTLF